MRILLGLLLLLPSFAPAASTPGESWEKFGEEEGIVYYRREVPGSSIVAFRGEAEVDASIARIMGVLKDFDRQGEWTESSAEARLVRTISSTEFVEYNRTSAPWPFKDRDFVFRVRHLSDEAKKRLSVLLGSVEDPAAPVRDCCVRGQITSSYYVMEYVEPARTKVAVEIEADPKGNIPKWIVNFFQKGWPLHTLQGLRKQVAKPEVKDHPEFIGLFRN